MKKKISIITINYNNLEGLERTIKSVINQTYREFEYIVIDGGSDDGSKTYIESNKEEINYWVSEKDYGIYNAMNKGVKFSNGEYLLFLNSGDELFSKDVIKDNYSNIHTKDLIYFNLEVKGGNYSKIYNYPKQLKFSDLFFGSLPHAATFIKKDLFFSVGMYDEELKIVSDWKFFIKALFIHKCSYIKVNRLLSIFYLGGISTTEDNELERNSVLNEYFSQFILDYKELKIKRIYYNKYIELINSKSYKLINKLKKILIC
jgi:glycosyltransferase involved in cell wall biosynthesis